LDRHSLWVQNDSVKRLLFLKFEVKRRVLKASKTSNYNKNYTKQVSAFYLTKLSRFNAKTFSKNRCVITGRAKAIDKATALSRFSFRSEAYRANIPGLRRAS